MPSKKRDILTLIISVILLIAINYNYLDDKLENYLQTSQTAFVERVIDGDTIVIAENKTSVRMLGINTPEKGEPYYKEAKEFLESVVLNKTVRLEAGKEKTDRYGRLLRYIYIDERDINLELVKNGFANAYFPSGKDRHYNQYIESWKECMNKGVNLCEKSEDICSDCIELKEFDYAREETVFYNKCNFECELTGWSIKDEGRKKFVFPDFALKSRGSVTVKVGEGESSKEILYWKGEEYVWTGAGDTLFLRNKDTKIILWKSY